MLLFVEYYHQCTILFTDFIHLHRIVLYEYFKETTKTFKGSTKMEISTGKSLKSRREKLGKVALPPP